MNLVRNPTTSAFLLCGLLISLQSCGGDAKGVSSQRGNEHSLAQSNDAGLRPSSEPSAEAAKTDEPAEAGDTPKPADKPKGTDTPESADTPKPDDAPEPDDTSETVAVPAAINPASLRFSKIVAGTTRWCGLTKPETHLVCVENGEAAVLQPGPLLDFDMSEGKAIWNEWCAIRADHSVVCKRLTYEGQADHVSVGMFSACVSNAKETTCLTTPGFGAVNPVPKGGGPVDVSQWSLCRTGAPLHASCVGRFGEQMLPEAGHYLAAAATPLGACVAVLGSPLPSNAEPELQELIGTSQVVCFSQEAGTQEIRSKVVLPGVFNLLATDTDGSGCAFGGDRSQLECWGKHATRLPRALTEPPAQLSVSTTQVCVLSIDGKADCYSETP